MHWIELQVGFGFSPVEHLVGAHVDQVRVAALADEGQVLHAQGVDPVGQVRIALAAVHVGVGGRINHHVGLEVADSLFDAGSLGDVVLGQVHAEESVLA